MVDPVNGSVTKANDILLCGRLNIFNQMVDFHKDCAILKAEGCRQAVYEVEPWLCINEFRVREKSALTNVLSKYNQSQENFYSSIIASHK